MEQLKVNYSSVSSGLNITLNGNLTLMDALELKSELSTKVKEQESVTIDMTSVKHMDLTGLNALLMAKKVMGDMPLNIKVNDGHEFHNLVHLTKFQDQFVISK